MNNPAPPPPPPGWEKIEVSNDRHVVGDHVELSAEQQAAVERILEEDYEILVLTGQAGSGKSTVANYLMEKHGISTCATTGKAAVGNGSNWTVDALFGIRRDPWSVVDQLAEANLPSATTIILIDEGSMAGKNMTEQLYRAARMYGKRIVLVGDWAQAKPVKDEWITESPHFHPRQIICLKENHRQSGSALLRAFNKLRMGTVDEETATLFKSRVLAKPPRAPGWVRMFATNRETDKCNIDSCMHHCDANGLEPFRLQYGWTDIRPRHVQQKFPLSKQEVARKAEEYNLAAGDTFAMGAQVMILRNAPRSVDEDGQEYRAYCNGDVGTLEDLETAAPSADDTSTRWWSRGEVSLPVLSKNVRALYIRLERNNELVVITRNFFQVEDTRRRPKFKIHGFPVKLGWALTIHKSQGTTVDKAWLDMGSIMRMPPEGRHGLAYVGLTRARTLEGLYISAWVPEAIVCDDQIKPLIVQ